MSRSMRRSLRSLISGVGDSLKRVAGPAPSAFPHDFDAESIELLQRVAPFTMTSRERILSLCDSVRHIVKHSIPGDIVECGVWKGGSMMAAALVLMKMQVRRQLWLFDTFDGMPAPAVVDVDFRGRSAAERMAVEDRISGPVWAYSSLDEVRRNIGSTGYPDRFVSFVEGKVEDTIPANAPDRISLLRLDTDWYDSTRHELQHLYPRLSTGGVLIIDDYGHWAGAKKAVDEYIEEKKLKILLHRIDYTGRIAVKIES